LDRLAADGVRMVDAYAPSSWTLPSHISMLTGVTPLVHGVETEGGTLDPSFPTLAEVLRSRGYQTAGIYSAPYLDPHWGFARGFDDYEIAYPSDVAAATQRAADLRAQAARAASAHDWARYDELKMQQVAANQDVDARSEKAVTSDRVAAAVIATLEKFGREPRPWFVFAHLFDPHCDYVPPAPYDTRFDPDYTGTATGEGCLQGEWVGRADPDRPGGIIRAMSERDLEHVIALYEGEVAWTDAHVGKILQALDDRGLTRTTLVIVVSDHGEEFFEHGNLGHRQTLYEEVVRIPMLLRLPGVLPAGAAVHGTVSLTDLVPTVLDLLDLPPVSRLGGTSFAAIIRDRATDGARTSLERLVMMFPGHAQVDADTEFALRQIMVQDVFRTGPLKVTRTRRWPQFPAGLRPELNAFLQAEAASQYARETVEWIDVKRFPTERPEEQSQRFTEPAARAALDAFRAEYARLAPSRKRQETGVPQNIRQQLERLGYADGGSGPAFVEPNVVLPPPAEG
jgi:arylsulfatase A-like enzyme